MADRVSEFARHGQWDEYKQEIKRKWKKYIKSSRSPGDGPPLEMERDVLMLMANKLAVEMLIEPELWQAARNKAGDDIRLKATVRELLKMWTEGKIDPWE